MPTYTYECPSCEGRQEHWLGIASHPDAMPCKCGGTAEQVMNWDGGTIVRGRTRDFKLDAMSVPVNWEYGNTDVAAQHRRYEKHIGEKRKLAIQNEKAAIKGGFRQIACIPRELDRMRSNQFGKDHFSTTTQSIGKLKEKLKADDLLFKD